MFSPPGGKHVTQVCLFNLRISTCCSCLVPQLPRGSIRNIIQWTPQLRWLLAVFYRLAAVFSLNLMTSFWVCLDSHTCFAVTETDSCCRMRTVDFIWEVKDANCYLGTVAHGCSVTWELFYNNWLSQLSPHNHCRCNEVTGRKVYFSYITPVWVVPHKMDHVWINETIWCFSIISDSCYRSSEDSEHATL